jgi:hypothetical protein
MHALRLRLLLLAAGAVVAGAACCHVCETPDAGTTTPPATTTYSCQALAVDSSAPGCIGGPPPQLGGPSPDPDKRYPLGCNGLGMAATAGQTINCICQATSSTVDANASQPIWVCK